MRKFILTVLFCLGLFVVHQRVFSQEKAVAVPAPAVTEAETPPQLQPPAAQMFPEGGLPMGAGAPLMGMDPRVAAGMREQLTRQYRDISQLIGRVDPRDTQFIETLRQEQASILEQLKSLEAPATRAVGANEPVPAIPPVQRAIDRPPFQGPPVAESPFALPPNWEQLPPDVLAKFFAEQAQANPRTRQFPATDQVPAYQPPPFGAVPTIPPRESFSVPSQQGLSAPWETPQSSQEISELKGTISALQQQIGQMRDEIKALETQMRLLNQNILNLNGR
ncbi:MAG: hypothetical protein FWC43_01760 [Planctomycetaceae bacterium]|nr:hypothetical protein [Planctomycetaceae bacterium]